MQTPNDPQRALMSINEVIARIFGPPPPPPKWYSYTGFCRLVNLCFSSFWWALIDLIRRYFVFWLLGFLLCLFLIGLLAWNWSWAW